MHRFKKCDKPESITEFERIPLALSVSQPKPLSERVVIDFSLKFVFTVTVTQPVRIPVTLTIHLVIGFNLNQRQPFTQPVSLSFPEQSNTTHRHCRIQPACR